MTIEDHLRAIGRVTLENTLEAEARGDELELANWNQMTVMVADAIASLSEKGAKHVH